MKKSVILMAGLLALALAGSAQAATMFAVQDAGANDKMVVTDTGAIGVNTGGVPQSSLHVNWPSAAVPGVLAPVGTSLYSISTGLVGTTQDNSFAADFTVADGTGTPGYRGTVRGVRARGTLVAPTAPILNDVVFSLIGGIWDGAAVRNTAEVGFAVDGTVSSNVAPQRIYLRTKSGGTGGWFERLTVKNDGKIGINAPAPTAILDVNGDTIRLEIPKTPASSAAACNQGDISWDASYIYVCTSANNWKRTALATF